jgi:hypothetical protein
MMKFCGRGVYKSEEVMVYFILMELTFLFIAAYFKIAQFRA